MSRVAAVVLAAGTSSRFRAADPSVATKLVARLDDVPMVRHVVLAALASRARPVVVVTGHARREVEAALETLDVGFAHNPGFALGLSTSLKTGLAALPSDLDGALILLGDMPRIGPALLDRLIDGFSTAPGIDAVVPVHGGRRGNPALIGRGLFGPAASLTGDEGARRLLRNIGVLEIDVSDEAVALDIDHPDALWRTAKGCVENRGMAPGAS